MKVSQFALPLVTLAGLAMGSPAIAAPPASAVGVWNLLTDRGYATLGRIAAHLDRLAIGVANLHQTLGIQRFIVHGLTGGAVKG